MIDNSPAALTFAVDGELTGNATCGRLSARWSSGGRSLAITRSTTGNRQCPPALMEQERRILTLLPHLSHYKLVNGGGMVLWTGDTQSILLRKDN